MRMKPEGLEVSPTTLAQSRQTQKIPAVVTYSFKFRSAFQLTVPWSRLVTCMRNRVFFLVNFPSCDRELLLVTLIFELNLDRIKVRQRTKYDHFCSNVTVTNTHTRARTNEWSIWITKWSIIRPITADKNYVGYRPIYVRQSHTHTLCKMSSVHCI